jgi:hypothetical protein
MGFKAIIIMVGIMAVAIMVARAGMAGIIDKQLNML